MRKFPLIGVLSLVLVLGLAASAAWAVPILSINDTGEGNVTAVPNSDLLNNPDITITANSSLNERVVVEILLTGTSFITGITSPTKFGIEMLGAPNGDEPVGSVSDFASVQVDTTPSSPTATQTLHLDFVSDGADDFDGLFNQFTNTVDVFLTNITENGQQQLLFDFSPVLQITAASDVPLPASGFLLGSGLLGLLGLGWRRKIRS
jgi:hypothetical protein